MLDLEYELEEDKRWLELKEMHKKQIERVQNGTLGEDEDFEYDEYEIGDDGKIRQKKKLTKFATQKSELIKLTQKEAQEFYDNDNKLFEKWNEKDVKDLQQYIDSFFGKQKEDVENFKQGK